MDAIALLELIRSRRSIRRYTNDAPNEQVIELLLEAATWAPSAHNRQPWCFAVITNPQVKERLAEAMNHKLRQDLLADGFSAEEVEKHALRRRERLTHPPVLILLAMSMSDMDRYPDALRSKAEWVMGIQSVALAGQNLLLMAHALGLGACWLCAPLFAPEVVREVLKLPDDWEPQAFIALGRPAETAQKARQNHTRRTLFFK